MSAVIGNPLLLGPEGYQISRSVRLRSSASAYFNRTNASSPTNAIKWTWSGWVKRGSLGAQQNLVGATNSGSDDTYFDFHASDQIVLGSYTGAGTDYGIKTVAVFRDPSAWYHVVAVLDTANATSADRAIIYVNGVRQTVTNSANGMWPQNATNNKINTASQVVNIGRRSLGDSYLDGYLTEINFIDGQALTPSSFGENDTVTGVWKPKKYAGTYGTNGFYLNFSDNSAATAAAIGKDYSGNGNNWTPNNISVTSGVTYDSMLDVPTMWADGGNGRGNYAVLNRVNQTTYGSLSDGNLKLSGATDWGGFPSSIPIPKTGKWYAEFVLGSTSSNSAQADCGIFPVGNTMYYNWSNSYGLEANNGFFLITNGSFSSNRGSTTAGGTVFQIAVDADSGKVWFGVNNAWYDTYNTTNGDPSAGTNPSGSGINFDSTTYQMAVKTDFNNWTANFGQRPFTYTPPTGFKALNTQNLPDSTIKKGNQYFDATTFDGVTGGGSVVNSGGMQPDLVWMKARNNANNHELADSVRGTAYALFSNLTNAEVSDTRVSSFNSNGFSYGTNSNSAVTGRTSVGWQWQAGKGTTSSNTSGSITSTVSVNATAGFSVVAYNSGASGDKTVGHGLGVAPSMIITKSRSSASYNWSIYHASVATTVKKYLTFTTDALQDNGTNIWGSAFPTSSVFGITSGNGVVASTDCIAYCFSAVAGFSRMGSFTGNGSSDGSFVYLGFRPRWIMIKRTDTAGNNWVILDTARDTYNAGGLYLYPNLSAAEDDYRASTGPLDILSNGFKPRSSLSNVNASGATYIYAAFAENPFKNALAR